MNNDLINRIRFLEAENQDLKSQLGYQDPNKLLRSTRYNSVSYDDTNNDLNLVSPSIPRYQPTSPRIMSDNYIAENPYQIPTQGNRNSYGASIGNNYGGGINNYSYGTGNNNGSINYLQSGGNWNNDTADLFNDLNHLKRENESLRQNAIALLRNQ